MQVNSVIKVYTQIFLAYIMVQDGYLKYNRTETLNKLPEILKWYAYKTIKLKLLQDNAVDEFKGFAQNYSMKTLGKNIFEFEIIQ